VGYTGGKSADPTYDSVCDGDGHTEALKIEYDESVTTYDDLLAFYWKHYHGSGSIAQYKAAIWVHDDTQREAAEASLQSAKAVVMKKKKRPKVEILPATEWYDAEEEHQKFHKKFKARHQSNQAVQSKAERFP